MNRLAPIRRLTGGRGVGVALEGIAIVSQQGFNTRYDLDPVRGIFCRPGHDLEGQSFANRIYCFRTPKGGIATSWALLDLKRRGLAPLGLVCVRMNPIVAQGAALAGLPILDGLEPDLLE
ncbi:MAG: DUF126 domain-containing protein, partial [Pigmentiphaga sp.]